MFFETAAATTNSQEEAQSGDDVRSEVQIEGVQ